MIERRSLVAGRQCVALSIVLHDRVVSIDLREHADRWTWAWSTAGTQGAITGVGSARDESGARAAATESARREIDTQSTAEKTRKA